MHDYAFRNSVATLIAGFVVGGALVLAGAPDPIPATVTVGTWFVIPAAVLLATVKGL